MKKPYKNNKWSEIKKWNSPHEAQKENPAQNGGKSGRKTLKKSVDRERNERKAPHHARSLARPLPSFSLSLSRYGAPSFLPGFCTEPGHPGNTRVHDRVASHLFVTHLYFFFILAYTEILTFYNAKHKRKLFLNPLAHSDIYLYLCVCVCARFRQNEKNKK